MSLINYVNSANSLTYVQYFEEAKTIVKSGIDALKVEDRELYEYYKLNLSRMERLNKTYSVSDDLKTLLLKQEEQNWVLIGESWCGDCAQIIPIISKMAAVNPKIKLLIFKRDSNLELMDRFLTDGKRSIPQLIACDSNCNEIFRWGARPKEAQAIVTNSISAGIDKEEWHSKLHSWYAANKGRAIELELIEKFSTM